ncbi:MAG: DNA polymerase III subunit delta [Anaerostipes sp.]|jgi:DNA polymerase-3 subunit delta
MKRINEDIKNGTYAPFYLLYGEEKYLIAQMRKRLTKALVSPEDTMNYGYFEGKKVDQIEVIDLANTLPFFNDYRLIVLDQTELGKKCSDDFLNKIKEVPDSTIMVFIEDTIDKRSKIYKFLSKNGYAASFDAITEKEMHLWLAGQLKQNNKKMTTKDAGLFLYKTGNQLFMVKNELEKLISYVGDREVITADDIETLVTAETTNQIFVMLEAIAKKQKAQAMELYFDLLELKESPFGILALLIRQCNQLLQTKSLMAKHASGGEIAKEVKVPPFVARKLQSQCQMFTLDELIGMIRKCAITDEKIKSGNITDRVAVELLIVEFSSKS